jgi:hypothetical protein
MLPEKEIDKAPATAPTDNNVDSLSHFFSTLNASSRDTVMFALTSRQFSPATAWAIAEWLNWNST